MAGGVMVMMMMIVAALTPSLALADTLALQEKLFLSSMGLRSRPEPTPGTSRRVPALMKRLMKEGERQPCVVSEYNVTGNIVRFVPDQGGVISALAGRGCCGCVRKQLFFNVSVLEGAEHLSLALLELTFTPDLSPPGRPVFSVELYRVSRTALRGAASRHARRPLLSQSVGPAPAGPLRLPLTRLARRWRNPGDNLGLEVELRPERGHAPAPAFRASLVVVSLHPLQCRSRSRRSPAHRPPVTPSSVCRPRRLYLDFREVGWQDWIIAPQGFMANYCHGECPFPLSESLNGTNHAILQTLVHSLEPRATPQPCCVPIRLSPVSMLYYDNNDNVVLRHYQDMVVDECGCR